MMKWIFALILILPLAGAAQSQGSFERVYQILAQDLAEEMATADFLTPELEKKYQVVPTEMNLSAVQAQPLELHKVDAPEIKSPHSIEDLKNYVIQRLGTAVVKEIENQDISAHAFAGTEASFLTYLKQSASISRVREVSSLYAEWGIRKFLTQKDNGHLELYFLIPPSYRYTEHFSAMIKSLKCQSVCETVMDLHSVRIQQKRFDDAALRIKTNLPDYDIVNFGYQDGWLSLLKNGADWKILNTKKYVDDLSGISATHLAIINTKTRDIERVLLIGSQRTVWGELASMMLKPFLHPRLKSAVFMGSAGAVSDSSSVYDVSIPATFADDKGVVEIQNLLMKNPKPVPQVLFGNRHGNTWSPMEQDMDFLKSIQGRLDTIDVEQSVLARTIADYNRAQGASIEFAAINVITDKPYNILSRQGSKHDLVRIDGQKKKAARLKAVEMVLKSLQDLKINAMTCERVFAL